MFSQLLKEVKCGIVWIIELNNFVNMRMHAIPRQTHFNSMLNKPCQNVTIEPKLLRTIDRSILPCTYFSLSSCSQIKFQIPFVM